MRDILSPCLQYDSSPDSSRTVHIVVAIYECESTGGSEWNLEDAIHFRNIRIPKVKVKLGFKIIKDFCCKNVFIFKIVLNEPKISIL